MRIVVKENEDSRWMEPGDYLHTSNLIKACRDGTPVDWVDLLYMSDKTLKLLGIKEIPGRYIYTLKTSNPRFRCYVRMRDVDDFALMITETRIVDMEEVHRLTCEGEIVTPRFVESNFPLHSFNGGCSWEMYGDDCEWSLWGVEYDKETVKLVSSFINEREKKRVPILTRWVYEKFWNLIYSPDRVLKSGITGAENYCRRTFDCDSGGA